MVLTDHMIPVFCHCRCHATQDEKRALVFGDRLHLLFLCVAAFEIGAAADDDDDAEMKERGRNKRSRCMECSIGKRSETEQQPKQSRVRPSTHLLLCSLPFLMVYSVAELG